MEVADPAVTERPSPWWKRTHGHQGEVGRRWETGSEGIHRREQGEWIYM